MAKLKKNLCGCVLTLASIVTAILSFVSLAFKPFAKAGPLGVTLKDWLDLLKNEYVSGQGVAEWKVARVFMIITLVLVAVATVLAVVKFFVSNKYVDIALAVVGGLAVVSAIVMMITLLVGSSKIGKSLGGTIKPGASPICLIVFSIVNGALAAVLGALSLAKKSK